MNSKSNSDRSHIISGVEHSFLMFCKCSRTDIKVCALPVTCLFYFMFRLIKNNVLMYQDYFLIPPTRSEINICNAVARHELE